MTERSSLAAIKAQMAKTKTVQEETLKKLLAIKSKAGASIEPAVLKELNKAIKAVENSLKLYANI